MTTTPQAWPEWYDGRHINEVLFCQQFLDKHPMKCVRGRLFTVDGLIEDEGQIGNLILEEISGVLTANLSKTVANLLASIKLQAYSPPLPIETDRIHVSNGTYFMDGSFTADKSYCNNRLTVSYNSDAPAPKRWLQFLSELLQPEDIPTLQEFLGYCLLPTTKGQKMLMLIGKGGEGKSRIGLVMRSLLGDSMNTTSIQKVESNRFSRADLENKLLMVDDDMDMSALPKTNYIKSIVTSECKMDMERKGVQSYQSQLYVRFLCFGNGALTALHDKSDGFFRRQIVLTTKDRPAGRADDPFLVDKLLREKEGIFLWCLEGLHRLIGNNYQFSISGKARENMETVASKLLMVRFVPDYAYIQTDPEKKAEAEAAALTLCTVIGLPELAEGAAQGILLAWAYGEAIMDIRTLISGGKVPLVKNAEDWKLSLSGLMQLGSAGENVAADSGKDMESGPAYREYLRMLLFLKSQDEVGMRTLDMVEQNLKIRYGQTFFRADACISRVEFHSTCNLRRGIMYDFPTYFGYN